MAITANDMLSCAKTLAGQPRMQEVTARAIVGRAYYAAYHDCLAWYAALPAVGSLPEGFTGGVHARLSELLQRPSNDLAEEVKLSSRKRGVDLRALHGDRCDADYELLMEITDIDARAAIHGSVMIKNTGLKVEQSNSSSV